ncbi:CLK4-associating serine/arginine rich protein-like, partial [Neopelma chrysocephalum]|uniref:CLK4-associating serine/arginine rich protein-like n=1 Tax=Neopelma chrysocephalum TaxID=114329 RepID=UPI000FCCFBB8
MAEGDFVRMLRKDKEEAEAIKNAKALEEEKAMYSGRRSRRQRREFREKRLKGRKISPPSYARRDSPTYDPYKRSPSESTSGSRSRSRTPSVGQEEKITFITSFGGSDEEAAAASQPSGIPGKGAPGKGAPGKGPTGPGAATAHGASARYARRDSPTYDPYKRSPSESTSGSRSRSRTPSVGQEEKITFITSFGGSDEEAAAASQPSGIPGKGAPGKGAPGKGPAGPGATTAHGASAR